MSRNIRSFGWAALLAALVVPGCESPTPPEPPVVQIASYTDTDGALVNETVAPETPVTFVCQASRIPAFLSHLRDSPVLAHARTGFFN